MERTIGSGSRPACWSTCSSERPCTYRITKKCRPSACRTEYTDTMFGWCSWAMVMASCLKRSVIPSPSTRPGDITLIADLAVERDVVRVEHGGHSAAAQLAADLELAEASRAAAARRCRPSASASPGASAESAGRRCSAVVPQCGQDRSVGSSCWLQDCARERLDPACRAKAISVVEIATASQTGQGRCHRTAAGVEPGLVPPIVQAVPPGRNVIGVTSDTGS